MCLCFPLKHMFIHLKDVVNNTDYYKSITQGNDSDNSAKTKKTIF